VLSAALAGCALATTAARAEVVPTGSGIALPGSAAIGPGGLVPGGPITVPGDIGELAGTANANLFHSFSVFNVLGTLGESVTFTAPSAPGVTVGNVISRVTGGTSALTGNQASLIDGSLTSSLPGANFFLINPNGVIFGRNASLTMGGSFLASTADAVHLGNDGVFYADPGADSRLTAAPPEAFGFLGSNPTSVRTQGTFFLPGTSLNLPAGATFALVGGDVDVAGGSIGHPSGRVSLASVTSAGHATIGDAGIGVDGFDTLGTVRMRGGHLTDAREVYIRAGRFELDNAIVSPGSLSFFGLGPAPNGGLIDVEVRGDFDLSGSSLLFGSLVPGLYAFTTTAGGAVPSIDIEAGSVSLSGVAQIRSERFGLGSPGYVSVSADVIEVRNGASITTGNFAGGGPGANLRIRADERLLLQGNGGVKDGAPFTGLAAQSFDSNAWIVVDAGSIDIEAGRLEIRNGAEITTDSFAFGAGGDIFIVTDHLVASRDGATSGGITSQSALAGDAGTIDIDARTIELRDGFQISATVAGVGDAGGVRVHGADSISMSGTNSGIFSAAFDVRQEDLDRYARQVSGTIGGVLDKNPAEVTFDDVLFVYDFFFGLGSLDEIFAAIGSDGRPGDGGAVSIAASSLTMRDDTRIDSSTFGDGSAGNIDGRFNTVRVEDTAQIRSRSGGIDRDTGELIVGGGNGGRIAIQASGIELSGASGDQRAGLSTSTLGAGDAGRIDVVTDVIAIRDGASVSSASSGTGVAGLVRIQASDRILVHGAQITTDGTSSDGGSIELLTTNLLDLLDAQITTSVGETASGGSIFIDPIFVVLQSSQILANAEFGPGGQILIRADQIIIDQSSSIAARSLFNPQLDGTVVVDAPESDVLAGVAVLPGSYLDVGSLLTGACQSARGGIGGSSLVVAGRGGVPVDPDGYLPSLRIRAAQAAGSDPARSAPSAAVAQQVAMLQSVPCVR
jgi:filamentous hemagglutinin family protein